jgi:hypothetical protein
MIITDNISLDTKGFCDIVDITPPIQAIVKKSSVTEGLVTVFCPGSTGSVTTIEYESGVLQDLKNALEKNSAGGYSLPAQPTMGRWKRFFACARRFDETFTFGSPNRG